MYILPVRSESTEAGVSGTASSLFQTPLNVPDADVGDVRPLMSVPFAPVAPP
jgi:hypothetical protein